MQNNSKKEIEVRVDSRTRRSSVRSTRTRPTDCDSERAPQNRAARQVSCDVFPFCTYMYMYMYTLIPHTHLDDASH